MKFLNFLTTSPETTQETAKNWIQANPVLFGVIVVLGVAILTGVFAFAKLAKKKRR